MSEDREDQHGVHRLCDMIQDSATRIKLVVYPALFAFVVLAAYGFFLIYNLTADVRFLAHSVDKNMTTIAQNMRQMEGRVASIDQKMSVIGPMSKEMAQIRRSIEQMNYSINVLNTNVYNMQRSMHQISRPMSFFP